MPFPKVEHVIYERNTLQQVICQLRFPSILLIDSQLPAQFQERIRGDYPLFQEHVESITNQIPERLMSLLPTQMKETLVSNKKTYEFISSDKTWVITLARDAISLTSNHYNRWFDFKKHFNSALHNLIEIYSPAFFSRIGLRYQNVIQRSKLGIDNLPWSMLLQPYIAGPLSDESVSKLIISSFQTFEIELQDQGIARIQHGLVEVDDKEECYLIDSDLFTGERTEVDHAIEVLDGFNRNGTRLFQWCITPRLHTAMEPLPAHAEAR
jgi:uncharacterized protein (TIGR04255 family)